jgi:ABC-2 type transport system permease protein
MSIATIERPTTATHWPQRGLNRRMVSAEFLKARRRRGLVAWSALLTVGAIVLTFSILAIVHSVNPVKYGPAGGVGNLSHALNLLFVLGGVAAVLVGASMGAGDLQAGVFRDLVSTGRSRLALFIGRIPGGLLLLLPLVALAWALASIASVVFAGNLVVGPAEFVAPRLAPGIGTMIEGGLWVLLAATLTYLLALGIASLSGSRSITVGVLLAWQLAVSQLLLQVAALGAARQGIPGAALGRLLPAALRGGERLSGEVSATMSLAVAGLVIAAWALIPLVAGAWRTQTRDA